jgi:glycosyltransferase involved in cell wall biosynthesis
MHRLFYFTIVIPTLHSPFIDQTLKSIHEQRYDLSFVEVIVVGQDRYGLVQEDNLVHFDRSSVPLSPAEARNRGMEQAAGDIIVFLDSDCLASSDWLSVLAERYQDPETYVVGGAVDFAREQYWSLADNISMFHEFMVESHGRKRSQLPSLNLSARCLVFDDVGVFDERYPRPAGEDADLTIRMRKAGFKLHFEPRAIVYHHPSRNGLMDLLRHSFYQGRYSTKVDPRHGAQEGLPWAARTRVGLVLLAPLLAAGATGRIFIHRPDLWLHWHIIPAIYISKLAWCMGAATHPSGLSHKSLGAVAQK